MRATESIERWAWSPSSAIPRDQGSVSQYGRGLLLVLRGKRVCQLLKLAEVRVLLP